MAARYALLSENALRLAERFWPGALTIVVNKQPDFISQALASGDTAALRVPDNVMALAVIEALDGPVTGTSANRSGGPDPASADEVRRQLGDEVDMIVDGGACPVGVSSTIVDCTGDEPRTLRVGALSEDTIRDALR
jgi:L-threonylcarbamoyladenylate synthase